MTSTIMTKAQALKVACELVQKFGFVSRDIVWKHLSQGGIASKYRYWNFLTEAPELSPYKAGLVSQHHLMLSNEYRRSLGEGASVSNRSSLYFAHDEYLMELVLYLKAARVIAHYWTEQELKMDRLLALRILGGDPDKVPDMVIDLKTESGPVRVAIEIEKTRKSQKRYKRVQLGYYTLRKIDLLLFGAIDLQTEAAIRQEFDRASFSSEKRSVGYFSLKEFTDTGLRAELRIRGKRPPLGEFLQRVCGNAWLPVLPTEIKSGEKVDNSLSTQTPFEAGVE